MTKGNEKRKNKHYTNEKKKKRRETREELEHSANISIAKHTRDARK